MRFHCTTYCTDPDECDNKGRNALHHACRFDLEEGADIEEIEELISLLLEK